MTFRIMRTSAKDNEQPCIATYSKIQRRGAGGDAIYWYKDFKTLEELLQFQDHYGEIIIGQDSYGLYLEIYDQYR